MTISYSAVEHAALNLAAAWLVAAACYLVDRTSLPEPSLAFVSMTVVGGTATVLQRSGIRRRSNVNEPSQRAPESSYSLQSVALKSNPDRGQAEPAVWQELARDSTPKPHRNAPPADDRLKPNAISIDWASYGDAPPDELQCGFCGGFDTSAVGTCAVCGTTTATNRTDAVVIRSWLHREPGD